MITGEYGFQAVFRQGEGHADGLGLGDDHQRRGVIGRHQVAHVQLAQAQAPGDGCTDIGEFEVEPGIVDRRLVGLDRTLVLAHQRHGVVQGLLGDAVLGIQPAIALEVDLGVLQLRLVLQQGALGLEQGVLVGPRIDLRQQVAGLDHLPFLEVDLDQFSRHPAAHIDGVQRGHRTQGLVVQREIPLGHRQHPHRDRPAGATEAGTQATAAAGMPGGGFLLRRLLVSAAGWPEYPAQASDQQQDKQAEQPAARVAGSRGLHGRINHWARGSVF